MLQWPLPFVFFLRTSHEVEYPRTKHDRKNDAEFFSAIAVVD